MSKEDRVYSVKIPERIASEVPNSEYTMENVENRIQKIGILIHNYEEYLNEALKCAKKLSEWGISHPWINRTDLTTERGPNTGMRSCPTKPRVDERLIGGLRMRLEIR